MPFVVSFAGTHFAEYFRILPGVSLFYLPIPLGIVMISWWGPRVLAGFFLNAILSAYLWGFTDPVSIILLAGHQTSTVFLSWFLCRTAKCDVISLGNTQHLIEFIVLGLAIPITSNSLYAYFFGRSHDELWTDTVIIWFVDFFTVFVIVLPLIILISPLLERKGWLCYPRPNLLKAHPLSGFSRADWLEMTLFAIAFVIVSQTLDFEKYWFAYGAGSVMVAVRLGFNAIVLINFLVYVITYLMPFFNLVNSHVSVDDMRLINLHIGMSLLSVSAAVIGRVITDLKNAKEEQLMVNRQLKTMNQELDSFVYSVSHDLSSPLKSVQGLINVMRLENDYSKTPEYMGMIEKSVTKLEKFIHDVLDYSRSSRKEVAEEDIDLKALIDEILENHQFMDSFDNIDFKIALAHESIKSDKLLVKTILSNLISNSIKYQKGNGYGRSSVEISARKNGKSVEIRIADDGEGIPANMVPRIFEMFYKGDQIARGSGLGLYIAKAASEKISARLKVESVYGEGSTFYLEIDQ